MAKNPGPHPDVGGRRRQKRRVVLLSTAAAIAATAPAVLGGATGAGAATTTVACDPAALITALHAAADSGSSSGTLSLAAGCAYNLTAAENTTDGGNALPVIYGHVTVNGNGATINRGGTASYRIFEVASGGSLTLNNLAISNGQANDTGTGSIGGGGILTYGALSVSGVSFTGNSSPAHAGVSGGGISGGSNAVITISGSTFTGNWAQEGGAFLSQGTTTVTDSTFSNNTATDFGGGAFVTTGGTTSVRGSTFVGNLAKDTTGHTVGGGAIDNDATVHVTRSTFVSNVGGSNGGGAIQNFGTMTISQSTIASNDAASGASIHNLDSSIPAVMTISQSIIADPTGGGTNCSGKTGAITDGGYNLSTDASCELSAAAHSLVGKPAGLQGLASNGGPTQTMAITAASAAFNAIPASVAGCTGTSDQRGVSRPQGTACDIGAFELNQATPPPTSTPPTTAPPPTTGPSTGQPVFSDLAIGAPFYDDIAWLAQQKLTTGFADGTFRPALAVSREAMAAYVYRYAHGGNDGGVCTGAAPFPDVPAASPFCADIAWLHATGLSTGYADGNFHPGSAISRQAIAAFLYRLAHGGKHVGACPTASRFTDVPAGSQFCAAIGWMAATSPATITTGYPDGTFHPIEDTSRQAMAAYLHRYDEDFHAFGKF